MKTFLKKILPDFIVNYLKRLKRKSKYRQINELKDNGIVLSKESIASILKSEGIKQGDILLAHSSLSSLGYVEGGAKTVIDALLSVLGAEGTLLMPAFPAIGFNYDYLKFDPVLDVKNTPSRMGSITESFRKLPGVKRSLHPTDSVCAYGKYADFLVKDHFGQLTPYNENSPFRKLEELNGKILLLGTKLEHVTNFHTPEDAIPGFKFPVYANELISARLIDEAGKELTMQTRVHNKQVSKLRQCNAMEPYFKKAGFYRSFKLGQANCAIIDANAMHDWLVENYKKNITIYTPGGEELNIK